MAKVLDLLIFGLSYFLIVFGWLSKVVDEWLAITITLLSYLSFVFIFAIINHKRKNRKEISVEEMPVYFALMDRVEQTELFYNLVPIDKRISINSPYFTYLENDNVVLVVALYRFLNLTQEDISNAYRKGIKEKASKIIILSRKRERKTITLTALLPIPFQFPDKWSVYKALKKHNALPPKPQKRKKIKVKRTLKEWREDLFNPKRGKYLIFTAIILALMSNFTPLKTYYLIMATIPFVLGISGVIMKNIEQ